METYEIFTKIALYIMTLYVIYFLFRFVVDMIKDSLLSDNSVDKHDLALYGHGNIR